MSADHSSVIQLSVFDREVRISCPAPQVETWITQVFGVMCVAEAGSGAEADLEYEIEGPNRNHVYR